VFRYSISLRQHSLKHFPVVPHTVAASDEAVGAVQESDDHEVRSDEYDSADEEIRQFYLRERRRREEEFGAPDERNEDVAMEPTTYASPGQQFVAGEDVETEGQLDGTPPPKRRKTTTEEEAASNSTATKKCRILLKKIPTENIDFDNLAENVKVAKTTHCCERRCPYCSYSTQNSESVRFHITVVHFKRYLVRYYELGPNTCGICQERFVTQKAFLKHFAYAHQDVLPSKCALPKRDARTKPKGKQYNFNNLFLHKYNPVESDNLICLRHVKM